ncbi:hypothetical protein CEXT_306901 [Caerostris extrusa]|uniref:Uncharacterized protein n=1 Tax=Caerostris extrusa TaxID=172846 RepID=A0AAV4XSP0_CAEEX|nr:hypothetical protein CEXT_306901 [Caerostris extrusa]
MVSLHCLPKRLSICDVRLETGLGRLLHRLKGVKAKKPDRTGTVTPPPQGVNAKKTQEEVPRQEGVPRIK